MEKLAATMLVLASKSPARRDLLTRAGLEFAVQPAELDERALEQEILGIGGGPAELARQLARHKALAISRTNPAAAVIGADQTLGFEGRVLHKVGDLDAARTRLAQLAGRTHSLYSGIALARNGAVLWDDVAEARLTMKPADGAMIDAVLAREGEEVLSSVGAYRLEGPSVRLFEHIEGDYFTILGLPLLPLLAALDRYAPETLGS